MQNISARTIRLVVGLPMLLLLALAQKIPPEIGKGWMPEFKHACDQLNALAEAIPAEKFNWRPAPGVRSVSEVYMHVAIANYGLMGRAGIPIPADVAPKIKSDTEKVITAKADVIQWLKDSQQFVRDGYPKVDKQSKVNFLGKNDTTAEGVLLRLLVHNHEHMGQSIAYARMIGVVPPWSQ